LVVTGGVGVSGAIYAGSIQNTAIGSTTRSTGAFTTLTANSTTTVTATTASTSTTTGAFQVSGGVGIGGALYAGSIQNTPIGATTANTGRFTTLTTTGATTLSPANAAVAISPTGTGTVTISPAGALTINPSTTGTINNMSIGATTRSTGAFTTLQANNTTTITGAFDHSRTDFSRLARGTTAQRGTGADGNVRYNSTTQRFEFAVGTTWRPTLPGFTYQDVASNITAAVWHCYFVDTAGGARTVTLPNSGLVQGDTIRFFDLRKTFNTNALTVARNGTLIMGDADNLTVTTQNAAFELVWHGTTYGWRIFSI
jgi:hypothetical protein